MEKSILRRISLIALFAVATLQASAQLPAITVKTLDGKAVRVDTLSNGGKPIIIDFFATWCKPCNRELKAIHEVYEDWVEETGVKLIAISIDQAQNVHKVKPLVDSYGWEYDILLDTNSDLTRALGIQTIPYVLILDVKGQVAYKHNGYVDGAEEELIEKVRELTGKKTEKKK